MTNASELFLVDWAGWAPGLIDRPAWLAWLPAGGQLVERQSKPACADVPALLRRRFSLTSRMAIEAAMNVCRTAGVDPARTQLFHGSANGENQTLKDLLAALAVDQPLSPTSFSNTVHHVPTGHFSMFVKHRGLARTISAFEDTFACTFLDMACRLRSHPDSPALLIIAEENLPEPFDQMLAQPIFPHAIAMLFSSKTGRYRLGFNRPGVNQSAEKAAKPLPAVHGEPVFEFLRWIVGSEPRFQLESGQGVYEWTKC